MKRSLATAHDELAGRNSARLAQAPLTCQPREQLFQSRVVRQCDPERVFQDAPQLGSAPQRGVLGWPAQVMNGKFAVQKTKAPVGRKPRDHEVAHEG